MQPVYASAYYTIYSIGCAALIIVLLLILHRAGRLFLDDAFPSNLRLSGAVRHLLDIGYYLVCLGYVTTTFQTDMPLNTPAQLSGALTLKLGFFLLLLGALHVFNLLLLALFRRRTPAAPQVSASPSAL